MSEYALEEISEEQAKELYETRFWETMDARQIAGFQLYTDRLCMPFDVFHRAISEALGRDVYTHEFALNVQGLREEFLGCRKAPTLREIIELIPAEKRVVVVMGEPPGDD